MESIKHGHKCEGCGKVFWCETLGHHTSHYIKMLDSEQDFLNEKGEHFCSYDCLETYYDDYDCRMDDAKFLRYAKKSFKFYHTVIEKYSYLPDISPII